MAQSLLVLIGAPPRRERWRRWRRPVARRGALPRRRRRPAIKPGAAIAATGRWPESSTRIPGSARSSRPIGRAATPCTGSSARAVAVERIRPAADAPQQRRGPDVTLLAAALTSSCSGCRWSTRPDEAAIASGDARAGHVAAPPNPPATVPARPVVAAGRGNGAGPDACSAARSTTSGTA